MKGGKLNSGGAGQDKNRRNRGMNIERRKHGSENHQEKQSKSKWTDRLFLRRPPALFNPVRRLFEPPVKLIGPYVENGYVVADIGCGSGYYTLALAQLVGPAGKVYAVDLSKNCIRGLKKKARKRGCLNLEAHASSASDISFIKDHSVDFVLANGLLCSMADHREEAVKEIARILKETGQAYISLGAGPPFGYVDKEEWVRILGIFKVEKGGSYKEKWALVSVK
jgi:SAM-dependent methyltransferase